MRPNDDAADRFDESLGPDEDPLMEEPLQVGRYRVEKVLGNVCPNCGGGFVPRPIRPSTNWKGDNFLGKDPASTRIRHRPVDPATHSKFSASIRKIPPEKR